VLDEPVGTCSSADIDALYRRHQPMVYRYCLSMLRTPEAAADASQSTWMRAMVALSAPDAAVRNASSWLRTIARNECLDLLRERGSTQALDIDELELAANEMPDGAYETREEFGSLMADLRTLSQRQRSAIVLREMGGLGAGELADAIETTPERALGLVADARRTLVERRNGRQLACTEVRSQLECGRRSAGLRAHLDSCGSCQRVDRRRRGRSLSSLALAPWTLLKSLVDAIGVAGSASVAVKGVLASALLAGSLAVAVPVVVPHGADRPAAAPAHGQDTNAGKLTRHDGRGATTQRSVSGRRATPSRSTGKSAPAAPAERPRPRTPQAPTDQPAPAAAAPQAAAPAAAAPVTARERLGAVDHALKETVGATGRAVDKALVATQQTVDKTVAATQQVLDKALTATQQTVDKTVAATQQAPVVSQLRGRIARLSPPR
jgi:RNA polymerase sigma factor (sigma-70 family)